MIEFNEFRTKNTHNESNISYVKGLMMISSKYDTVPGAKKFSNKINKLIKRGMEISTMSRDDTVKHKNDIEYTKIQHHDEIKDTRDNYPDQLEFVKMVHKREMDELLIPWMCVDENTDVSKIEEQFISIFGVKWD